MEASTGPPRLPTPPTEPNMEKIKQNLLQKGVYPTPKILHTLRKKQLQKSLRKSKRRLAAQPQPFTHSQNQSIAEESRFRTLKAEYKAFSKTITAKTKADSGPAMVGKPWERLESVQLRDFGGLSKEFGGQKLKSENLRELSEILERECDKFRWILDDDIELEDGWLENRRRNWDPQKRRGDEAEVIRFLVDKLSGANLSTKDWKLSKMMKKSGLQFTEGQLLKIVEGLGDKGQWRQASSVVEWVYSSKEHRHYKSRFVYTKLLAVLGKARRPHEALQIFDVMREDCQIYPDMPAYHSVAVTLGQAGFLKELLNIMECMRQKPAKRIKNMCQKNWDPILQPDVVVFNAVLNACVQSHQWKGVSWVFEELRKNDLRPNGATYGLAMEVMLESGKFDLVHELFGKMRRSGEAPKALTYRVLVRAFWEEGKVDEAVQAVRDMEQRGVFGAACVYYELACCLCNNGRWQEALLEVEKLKKLPRTKPLGVTFTGMIISSMNGGHIRDCISIFEHFKDRCAIDIGIVNTMLNVYGKNDMFSKAKELFEETKRIKSGSNDRLNGFGSSLNPDGFTYRTMLEASASALQWEYFEYVYREMALSGYLLDQSKAASLLIKASRAGKWYLLEHAFDTTLEAGEIPHLSVFNELICQSIIQRNYGQVVIIVKAMAYAPFQVNETQWTALFERNRDKISRESLEELLQTLKNSDLPMEATVSNLSRSLFFLCRYENWEDISSQVDLQANGKSTTFVGINDRRGNADSEMFGFTNSESDGDKEAKLFTSLEELDLDMMASDESDDDLDDKCSDHTEYGNLDIGEVELNDPTGIVIGTRVSNLPSADEILESWKQSRKRDGIFFPFQFGRK